MWLLKKHSLQLELFLTTSGMIVKRKCIKVGRNNKEPNVQKYFFIVSKAGAEEEKIERYPSDELRLEVALLKLSPAIYLGKSSYFVQS